MLTNRCRLPLVISRSRRPPWRESRSSMTSATVAPLASTDFSPPVWVRRMVGMDTVATGVLQIGSGTGRTRDEVGGDSVLGRNGVRAGVREHVTLHDLDVFLGHHTVHDPERPELTLGPVQQRRRAGGDEHVVRLGLGGV